MPNPKRSFRYRNLLILFTLYCIFWIILVAILRDVLKPQTRFALTPFLPLNDAIIELAFIFSFILPLSSIIGVIFGGYLITPIVLFLHKKIYGSKMHYGIQYEKPTRDVKLFSRSFFPVLMAINLSSLFLTPTIIQLILEADLVAEIDVVSNAPVLTRFLAEAILLMITYGVSTMFFSSVWFLKDSGIIYSNKERLVNSDESFSLKSIGDWLQTMLRSYAGIGAIITYIIIIYNFLTNFINNLGSSGNILNIPGIILWLGLPFYLAISLIPALIFNDLIKKSRTSYVRKFGKKIGIKDSVEITFEFKKKEKV
ncbi:MAG: hypothetical protein KAX18_07585 [Candidatus Lokiarchaeota archaeon]|nr:hypothetical protein [Candidatus Lokiarchaeota archaeon]